MSSLISDRLAEVIARLNDYELEDDEVIAARERDREAAEKRDRCIRQLKIDIGERHKGATIRNFEIYDTRQNDVMSKLIEIGRDIVQFAKRGRSLFLYGPPGTGKDHVVIALLKHAANLGMSCRWVDTQRLYQDVRDNGGWEHQLYSPDIVCLSDPVLEATTEANRKCLFRIVNSRYTKGRGTWVTCNIPICSGASALDRARELFGEQTISRLREDCERLYCNWPDYRDRNPDTARP